MRSNQKECPDCKSKNHNRRKRCSNCLFIFYDGTERSEALQGCPPSANGSAGARADAPTDSLISSVVPREKAVSDGACTISDLLSDIRHFENMIIYYQGRILKKQIAIEEIIQSKELRDEMQPVTDARQCNGERALARNS